MNFAQLSDINNFFYAGLIDVDTETQADILSILIQPKRSMFYNRSDGAGIPEYENQPITSMMQIMMAYDIVMAVSLRNSRVSNGSDGGVDKRVAVSQNSVTTEQNGDEVQVNVLYIPLYSMTAIRTPGISLGGRTR
jgi:hypothetical protein